MTSAVATESRALTSGLSKRLLKLTGDVTGASVLVVGSREYAELLKDGQTSSLALADPDCEPDEAAVGFHIQPGSFASGSADQRWDKIILLSRFEELADPMPEIARACALAADEVLAFFVKPKSGWLSRKAPEGETHSSERMQRLFAMAGAVETTVLKAPGGFVICADLDPS